MTATASTAASGVRALLAVAALMVVVAGLKAAATLLLPLLLALFLAMVALPLLDGLQRLRVPTPLAVLLTILFALLVLAVLVWLVGGSIRDFAERVPKYQARLEALSAGWLGWLERRGLGLRGVVRPELLQAAQVMDLVGRTLGALASVLSNAFLVILTVLFILTEVAGFPAKLRAAFGAETATARFERIRREIQRYLAIKSVVSLATGSLVAVGLALLRVDFALLWGVLAFLLNYVPTLGSILAGVPPTVLALVQLGPGHALGVVAIFVAVNVALGNFIEPYLMGRRLGLSTLVVFLSLVFWGWVWGPVGMLLSVPLTMVVKILLENTPDLRWVAVLLDAAPGKESAGLRAPRPGRRAIP